MSELLPCPFCGSEAIVHEVRLIPAGSRWEIHCKEIAGCGINQKGFLTKEAAMVQWNIRCRPSPWVKASERLPERKSPEFDLSNDVWLWINDGVIATGYYLYVTDWKIQPEAWSVYGERALRTTDSIRFWRPVEVPPLPEEE